MKDLIKKILKEHSSKEENLINIITKSPKSIISHLGGPKEIKKLFGKYDFYTPEFLEKIINNELDLLKEESEDWGLGEMDEYNEIHSVEKIKVVNLVKVSKIKVYVDIHTYPHIDRDDFDNLRAEIQYRLEEEWNPKIEIYINDIKKSDTINESKSERIKNFIEQEFVDDEDIVCGVFVEKDTDTNEYIVTIKIIGGYGTKYFPRTQYINRMYDDLYEKLWELLDNFIPVPHKILFEYVPDCDKESLDESIDIDKKILTENKDFLLSALRRVSFTEDDIEYYLKKYSLRFLDGDRDINLLIYKVCNFTSYELIEQGLSHMSDDDADKAVNELSKKLKDKYSGLIVDYINNLISIDDDETYCFRKHSDKYMNMLTNRGFGECVTGWVNFMSKYGSWFPDLNWNEVREKLDSNPNKYILIKNPLENHPYEYYFSVFKKS